MSYFSFPDSPVIETPRSYVLTVVTPALALLFAFGVQAPVTVAFPPTPLPKALEILSKPCRVTLRCTASLKDEVAVAWLKDASSEDTLKYLAESLDAKWEKSEDGSLLLIRDLLAKQKRMQEEAKKSEEMLEGSLAYLRKRLAEQPEEADSAFISSYRQKAAADEARRKAAEEAKDYARMFVAPTSTEESPGWRANAKAILAIGSKTLLKMLNDEQAVWAEKPTSMQRKLPKEVEAIFARYRREFALLNPEAQVTRIKLLAKRWEHGGSFNAAMIAYDPSGKEVDHAFVRLNNDSDLMKVPYTERDNNRPNAGETSIEIPTEASEVRIALSTMSDDPKQREFKEKWLPKLLDPVDFEPTQWHTGIDLVEAAKGLNKNLIGSVSDVTRSRYWQTKQKLTPSQVLIQNKTELKEMPGGWIVARPSEPFDRSPRADAKGLLQASYKAGGVSVDQAASWTARAENRWPFISWVGDYLSSLFSGGGQFSTIFTFLDEDALRFWDAIPPVVREGLKKGGVAKVSTLTPKAKTLLYRRVFWQDSLEGKDATDLFPNGIQDGEMRMAVLETPVIISWPSSEGFPNNPMPLDPETLGKYLAKGDSYRETAPEQYGANDRFLLGNHRRYKIRFTFLPENVSMEMEYGETFFDPGGKAVNKLPKEIAARVEKARQDALAAPQKGGGGQP